jgi:hypothetical protein
MEKCKFCNDKEAIKNSHIIPYFITKWVKDTSPTGFIRATNEPNIRQQDSEKSPLLCIDCENDFSKYEDIFKKQIFSKIANYRKPCPDSLSISNSAKKCIYSIAWRVLANTYYFPKENQYTEEEFNKFPEFLDEIKESMKDISNSKFKSYLIPCTKEVITRINLPKVEWFFYDRATGAEPRIWNDWYRFIIFIKIPFAIIVFEMVSNDEDIWKGCNIEESTTIELPNISAVPDYVGEQVKYFFDNFLKSREKITEKQNALIKEDMKKSNPNCGFLKTMKKKW